MKSGTSKEKGIGADARVPLDPCAAHTKQVERLERENRLRRELVSNVLHDIRSALAAVKGYLETPLVRAGLPAGELRQYLQTAHKHTVRLGALVDELFDLSVLDDLGLPAQRERFSLSELVMDTAMGFQLRAEKKRIRLTTDVGAEPAFTVGNIAQMQRVLENLIGNAIRFTPPSGEVAVSVAPGEDSVTVAVSDSGPGIPEDDLPRVFDRFFKAAPGDRTKSDSCGLGLAIVKQILDLHGSEIRVTSKVGAGARFEFSLPLIARAAPRAD